MADESIYTEESGQTADQALEAALSGQTPPEPAAKPSEDDGRGQQNEDDAEPGQTPSEGVDATKLQKRLDDQLTYITRLQRENAELRGAQTAAKQVQDQMNARLQDFQTRINAPQLSPEQKEKMLEAELDKINADPQGYVAGIAARQAQEMQKAISTEFKKALDERLAAFQPVLRQQQTESLYGSLAKNRPELTNPVFRDLMRSQEVVKIAFEQMPEFVRNTKTAEEIYADPMFHLHLANVAKEVARSQFSGTLQQSDADQAQMAELARQLGLAGSEGGAPAGAPQKGGSPRLSGDDLFKKEIVNAGGGSFEQAVASAFDRGK